MRRHLVVFEPEAVCRRLGGGRTVEGEQLDRILKFLNVCAGSGLIVPDIRLSNDVNRFAQERMLASTIFQTKWAFIKVRNITGAINSKQRD
jgi:hypothetical protein